MSDLGGRASAAEVASMRSELWAFTAADLGKLEIDEAWVALKLPWSDRRLLLFLLFLKSLSVLAPRADMGYFAAKWVQFVHDDWCFIRIQNFLSSKGLGFDDQGILQIGD